MKPESICRIFPDALARLPIFGPAVVEAETARREPGPPLSLAAPACWPASRSSVRPARHFFTFIIKKAAALTSELPES